MEPESTKFQPGDRVRVLVNLRAGVIGTVKLVNPYGQTHEGVNEYYVGFDNPEWSARYYVEQDLEAAWQENEAAT